MFRVARLGAACLLLASSFLLDAQSKQSASRMSTDTRAADWLSYNRDEMGDRYSPLTEITTQNVGSLRPVCTFDSGEKGAFESGPVAAGGRLYFTTLDSTFAVDAETCKQIWKQSEALTAEEKAGLAVNRGVAFADGKVFRGYDNGNVVAIDAATGKVAWKTPIAKRANGETLPAAPLAWRQTVFIGNAGGDNYGVTGRIYALDDATGKVKWQFDVVPASGPAAATWTKKSAENPPTGGATWTTYHLDPQAGVLWVGTGNVAPDFILEMHPGENLYANCVLALDAASGKLLAYVQPVKRDFHDWDMSTPPALITTRGGRKLAVAASKDGFVYGIDASGVKSGSAQPATLRILYQTAATTRSNVDAPLTPKDFTRFCPGSQGGAEWNGPAYSPAENLVFVPEIDWCTSVKLAPVSAMKGAPGKVWSGTHDGSFGRQDPVEKWGGWVTAIDADSGKVAWQYRAPTPVTAGVTPTAGGLVFSADHDGNVFALDAKSGKKLWSQNTGQPVGGGIVSFEAGGHQRIAAAAGIASPLWPKQGASARVVVYGLP